MARVRYEWDRRKNRSNIRKHGIDFSDAWEIFQGPMLTSLDDRDDYGEGRLLGIGLLRNQVVIVVYTEPEPDLVRIISVGKSLKHERRELEGILGNRLG